MLLFGIESIFDKLMHLIDELKNSFIIQLPGLFKTKPMNIS